MNTLQKLEVAIWKKIVEDINTTLYIILNRDFFSGIVCPEEVVPPLQYQQFCDTLERIGLNIWWIKGIKENISIDKKFDKAIDLLNTFTDVSSTGINLDVTKEFISYTNLNTLMQNIPIEEKISTLKRVLDEL